MKKELDLGYIVASITPTGEVRGFASGKIKNFRAAHAERRDVSHTMPVNEWRVLIVKGTLR